MKNIKKKIAALSLGLATMASSVMSINASAIWPTNVDWPGFYTPYTGKFYASTTAVKVSDFSWSSAQTDSFASTTLRYGLEFEFRPNGVTKDDVWSEHLSEATNMPTAFFEFQASDPDDIAIGCGQLSAVWAGNVYYASMSLRKNPSFNQTNLAYTFESEYGRWVPIVSSVLQDFDPINYAVYLDSYNNVNFGRTYSW